MARIRFHFAFPWITLYVALLIPAITWLYGTLPRPAQNGFWLWLSSPFNINYESASMNAIVYNYALVVLVYLFVELYSRNLADLKKRDSLIRNAFLLSVLASYIISAFVWYYCGFPSSGSSILTFNVLVFSAFETYDSELIRRMSERRKSMRRALELASITFVVLVLIMSALFYIYLNQNGFWYVHIAGGVLFAALFYVYLSRFVRPRIDAMEEHLESAVERDLEEAGIAIEEEAEKAERRITRKRKSKP